MTFRIFPFFSLLCLLFSTNIIAQTPNDSTKLVKGIYKTYGEFIANSPSITEGFIIKSKPRTRQVWLGTSNHFPVKKQSGNKYKNIWGFSNGTNVYIFHDGEFFPIIFSNNKYYFEGYDMVIYDPKKVVVAGILGGAIGGGIYSATEKNAAKNRKVTYKIDEVTGGIIHPDIPVDKIVFPKPIKVIFYRGGKNELENSVDFTVNDTIDFSFQPNSYEFISIEQWESIAKICIKPSNDCSSISVGEENTAYIQISYNSEDEKPIISLVSKEKGSYNSDIARKKQKKRLKKSKK